MVGEDVQIGFFVCLCLGVKLVVEVYIGNFVEVKNISVGFGLKVNYFIYLGDVEIGVGLNIGVGIIICNYDGVNKFKIIIGDVVFIGFNSLLVVFVMIGNGVIVGVGLIIICDVVENSLVVECFK